MRVRSSDQVSVAVHEFGGVGRPLLFSHATGFLGYCYLPVADHLTDRFQCWSLDYRGHGDTPRPASEAALAASTAADAGEPTPADVHWRGFGDDALAVARAIAPAGGLVAFGHSMGGAALLMAAQRHPELFDVLVLFEPIVFDVVGAPSGRGSVMVEAALRRRASFPSFEAAIENYASKPPFNAFDPDVTRLYVAHGFGSAPEGVRLKCSPEWEAGTFAGSLTHGTWDRLPSTSTRVVVVAGEDDGGPAQLAPAVAERLPNGTFVRVADGDHFTPFVDPAATAQLIIDAVR